METIIFLVMLGIILLCGIIPSKIYYRRKYKKLIATARKNRLETLPIMDIKQIMKMMKRRFEELDNQSKNPLGIFDKEREQLIVAYYTMEGFTLTKEIK